jgi:hypothetical protein
MNDLPNDVTMYIASMMDIPDVLMLCNINSQFNRIICNNQKYWMMKLLNDFPEYFRTFDIKNYGPDYKNYYRTYAYRTIVIHITIDQYNDFAEEYEYIYAAKDLTFHRNTDNTNIKTLVFNIISDFFDTIDSWGLYSILIDDVDICEDDKYLDHACFESINVDTTEITINFSSQEFVDETNDSLNKLLEDTIRTNKERTNKERIRTE